MKNNHKKKANQKPKWYILATAALLLVVVVCVAALEYSDKCEAEATTQIEKYCKEVLALEYANEPGYESANQKFEAAKQIFASRRFRNKSVKLILERAQKHMDSLEENPLLNYDIAQLENIITDTLSGTAGNWSVYFEIPGTDFQIESNNRTVNAASTIKLFNMITLYDELNRGRLIMTDALAAQLHAMITVSSNPDSNAVATAIGGGSFAVGANKVTALAHTLGATDTQEEHMIYDVKTITPGRNTTSVRDCATVLRKLYFGECVSPQYDSVMLDLLKQQTRNFKIPLYLPEGTVVAHKTGENSEVELDVGIVYSPNCDYILCVSVTDFGNAGVRHTIGELSEAIYTYLNE